MSERWRATGNPNDACCWSAHVETEEITNAARNTPTAIADVIDLEEAQRIALEHNAHDALVGACETILAEIEKPTVHVHPSPQAIGKLRAALAIVAGDERVLEHNAHDALVGACRAALLALRACTGRIASDAQQQIRAALETAGAKLP